MNIQFKDLVNNTFGKFIKVKDEVYEFLQEHFELEIFPSKTLLSEAGSVSNHLYLVKSGVQTMYIINQKGEKVVLGFTFSGSVSGAYDSFVSRKPSAYFMETSTHSELYAIHTQHFTELFERFPECYQWRALFMEEVLFGRGRREVELLTRDAKDRFDSFMKRCPEELLHIPQKMLASYINMKPETFSRFRAIRD